MSTKTSPDHSTRSTIEPTDNPPGPLRLDPEFISQLSCLADHLGAAQTLVVFPTAGGDHKHVLSLGSCREDEESDEPTHLREHCRVLQEQLTDTESIVRSGRGLEERSRIDVTGSVPAGFEEYLFLPLTGEGSTLRVGLFFYFTGALNLDRERVSMLRLFHDQLKLILKQSDFIDNLLTRNADLKDRARRDSLTGLPNQESILRTLEREHSRARRYQTSLSVMMADLDYFKQVNDEYGHQYGDRVLKRVSSTFEQSIRSSDTVGRYGGEEFLFVMPEIREPDALGAAERLRSTVARQAVLEGIDSSLRVTVSLGATEFLPAENQSVHALVNQADRALYRAKDRGRNQSVGFSGLPDPAQETAV